MGWAAGERTGRGGVHARGKAGVAGILVLSVTGCLSALGHTSPLTVKRGFSSLLAGSL